MLWVFSGFYRSTGGLNGPLIQKIDNRYPGFRLQKFTFERRITVMLSTVRLVILVWAVFSIPLLAQDLDRNDLTASPASTSMVSATPAYVPLTLGQNYMWSVHNIVDPERLFLIAAKASFDHASDDPSKWGEGMGGYATRVSSRLGYVAVRENVAFGLRALDHEDPRYVRMGSGGGWERARHAVVRSVLARNEKGNTMPAYSELVADFGTPFIAQTWHPGVIRGGREFTSGGMALGVNAFTNLCSEFWPDIRKKLARP
jgi:hypothetical protein